VKLLLDESLPKLLRRSIPGHEVKTVQEQGWSGKENGELLMAAASAGFDGFVTADKGFEHQQNPTRLPVTVAILRASSNRLEDLEPLMSELVENLSVAGPCSLIICGP